MHMSYVSMLNLKSMFEQLSMASLEFSINCLPQKLNTDERAREVGGWGTSRGQLFGTSTNLGLFLISNIR